MLKLFLPFVLTLSLATIFLGSSYAQEQNEDILELFEQSDNLDTVDVDIVESDVDLDLEEDFDLEAESELESELETQLADSELDTELEEVNDIEAEVELAENNEAKEEVEIVQVLDEVVEDPTKTNIEKNGQELLDELSALRKENINEIIEVQKRDLENKYTNSDIQALKVQLGDIVKSPLFTARIPRGTFLLDIKTNKKVYITQDINVKVHTLADFDKYLYITNKKGEIKYRVFNSSIQNITEITNLYQKPKYFKETASVQKVETFDKDFNYSLNINFHGGFNFPRYTRELLTDTTGVSTQTRVEVGYLTNHNFLFDYGLTGMYEATAGSLSSTNGSYSIKTFSIGPILKTRPILAKFKLTLASKMSLISDVLETRDTETRVHKLSEVSLSLGLERQSRIKKYGSFIWGANFQRKWLRGKAQNTAFDLSSGDNYDESLTLYIGHQSDWLW